MKKFIGDDTLAAAFSGFVIAKVLGRTSENTKTRTVITTVAKNTPDSLKISVNNFVARAAANILTRLLPSNIEPISFSLSSVILSALVAPGSPLSALDLSFALDAAVSAVSDPEKNADKKRSNIILLPVIRIFELIEAASTFITLSVHFIELLSFNN